MNDKTTQTQQLNKGDFYNAWARSSKATVDMLKNKGRLVNPEKDQFFRLSNSVIDSDKLSVQEKGLYVLLGSVMRFNPISGLLMGEGVNHKYITAMIGGKTSRQFDFVKQGMNKLSEVGAINVENESDFHYTYTLPLDKDENGQEIKFVKNYFKTVVRIINIARKQQIGFKRTLTLLGVYAMLNRSIFRGKNKKGNPDRENNLGIISTDYMAKTLNMTRQTFSSNRNLLADWKVIIAVHFVNALDKKKKVAYTNPEHFEAMASYIEFEAVQNHIMIIFDEEKTKQCAQLATKDTKQTKKTKKTKTVEQKEETIIEKAEEKEVAKSVVTDEEIAVVKDEPTKQEELQEESMESESEETIESILAEYGGEMPDITSDDYWEIFERVMAVQKKQQEMAMA